MYDILERLQRATDAVNELEKQISEKNTTPITLPSFNQGFPKNEEDGFSGLKARILELEQQLAESKKTLDAERAANEELMVKLSQNQEKISKLEEKLAERKFLEHLTEKERRIDEAIASLDSVAAQIEKQNDSGECCLQDFNSSAPRILDHNGCSLREEMDVTNVGMVGTSKQICGKEFDVEVVGEVIRDYKMAFPLLKQETELGNRMDVEWPVLTLDFAENGINSSMSNHKLQRSDRNRVKFEAADNDEECSEGEN